MTSYAIILAFVLGCCMLIGGCHERTSALTVTANFVANEGYVRLFTSYTPWGWFLLTDTAALLFLVAPERISLLRWSWTLRLPHSGLIGAILASTYATQCLMHISFGALSNADQTIYWRSLTAMAWLQVALLLIGGIYNGGNRVLSRLRGGVSNASAPYPAGLYRSRKEARRMSEKLDKLS